MRVLVTGGAGYVGSVSVAALLEAGHRVVVLDDLSTGHRAAVGTEAELRHGTYTDREAVAGLLASEQIDAVLHCAARSLVQESVANPSKYYRENVAGGLELLEAARTAGVHRFVFSSTAAVYGNPDSTPITEDAPTRPINPYGETKRTLEGALTWFGRAHGLRSISLRYFNVAGASDALGEDHRPESHLIPNVLRGIDQGGAAVIFGDDYPTPDGTCIRDYIHVADLASAHLLALEASARGEGAAVFNLGTGHGFSVLEVVAAAEAVTGRSVERDVRARRPGDPPVLVASPERARAELGWEPRESSLETMIGSALEWRRRHPSGYPE